MEQSVCLNTIEVFSPIKCNTCPLFHNNLKEKKMLQIGFSKKRTTKARLGGKRVFSNVSSMKLNILTTFITRITQVI